MVFLPVGTAVNSHSIEDNLACPTCANLVLCSFSLGMLLERLQFENKKKISGVLYRGDILKCISRLAGGQ